MAILHTLRTLRSIGKGILFNKRICPDKANPPRILTNRHYIGLRYIDLFGHVNNSRYLEIFELSRWEIFSATGFNQKGRKAKIFPVVGAFHVNYFREIKAFQVGTVQTCVLGTTAKGMQMIVVQHLFDAKKRLCATGILHVPLIDFDSHKPIPIREAFDRMGVTFDQICCLQREEFYKPGEDLTVESLEHWKKACAEKGALHLVDYFPKVDEHIASHPKTLEANLIAGVYLTEAAGSQRKWFKTKSVAEAKSREKKKAASSS